MLTCIVINHNTTTLTHSVRDCCVGATIIVGCMMDMHGMGQLGLTIDLCVWCVLFNMSCIDANTTTTQHKYTTTTHT